MEHTRLVWGGGVVDTNSQNQQGQDASGQPNSPVPQPPVQNPTAPASQNPQPEQPDFYKYFGQPETPETKPKGKFGLPHVSWKVWLIIVLLVLLGGVELLNVIAPPKDKTGTSANTASTGSDDKSGGNTSSSGAKAANYDLTQNIKLSKMPSWDVKIPAGWIQTTTGQEGYTQYLEWRKNGNGATFTVTVKTTAKTGKVVDADNSSQVLDTYLNQVKSANTTETITAKGMGDVKTKDGKDFALAQRDFTYEHVGKTYQDRLLLRAMDGYTVAVQYDAGVALFNEAECSALLKAATVEVQQ